MGVNTNCSCWVKFVGSSDVLVFRGACLKEGGNDVRHGNYQLNLYPLRVAVSGKLHCSGVFCVSVETLPINSSLVFLSLAGVSCEMARFFVWIEMVPV